MMKRYIDLLRYVPHISHLFPSLLILLSAWSCQYNSSDTAVYIPETPDYSDSALWYIRDGGKAVDVFYVTPTCIFDWKTEDTGLPCHHYDVYEGYMKENFTYSLKLADEIFGTSCNFYAPFYRQISLESWLEDEKTIEERFKLAQQDLLSAFQYYLEHKNHGKPFILAGYSQGAKAVVELVKLLQPQELARMKAAYVIGYRITQEDLRNRNLQPAQHGEDQGVVICYNSVKSVADRWPAVSQGSRCCINPVNWQTNAAVAKLNDSIRVQVDTVHRVLLVEGYKEKSHIPLLQGTLSPGNYHLSELTLYKECLQENLKRRIR